jgi:hypothetical protein
MYATRTFPCRQFPYMATFYKSIWGQTRSLYPLKKSWYHEIDWLSRRSELPHFPSRAPTVEYRGKKFGQVVMKLLDLLGPVYPACNRYVQCLLMGANPLVLNRHKWELQPWRCRLSAPLSPPFSTDGPPLFPKGLARSPINSTPQETSNIQLYKDLLPTRGLSTTQRSTVAYIYA